MMPLRVMPSQSASRPTTAMAAKIEAMTCGGKIQN
jgi:hypothetical protein